MSSWDSLDSWSNYATRPPETLEDILYKHLQACRQQESPAQLIERFRALFIEAFPYTEREVWSALLDLIARPEADREFKYTLNRCCYTLINPWSTQPSDHWAIARLIALFEELSEVEPKSRDSRRLRTLVHDFTNTDQYATLNRLRQFFESANGPEAETSHTLQEKPLGTRIRSYPFLYDNSLLTKDSTQEQKQNILALRSREEANLRLQLIRYQSASDGHTSNRRVNNPTLLDDTELKAAFSHYTGKVDGHRTQHDLACWFSTYSKTARSFKDFKEEFVDYLMYPIVAIEPKYGSNHFTRRLRQYLQETLSEFNGQPLNNFIVVETCRKLLNFLVVDSPNRPVFRNFRQLLNDLGHTLTVGLLLRVVLFCSAAKPWLERCFSVLFNCHEQRVCQDVPWLVDALEHTNVALISNFKTPVFQR